jgi:hypothetical protein
VLNSKGRGHGGRRLRGMCNSNFVHTSNITCIVAKTDKLSYISANINPKVLKPFMKIEEMK